MEIHLTPEQRDVVRYAVETGSIHDPEEAVQQAMEHWINRQRRRAEILARIDVAEASLARGEGITIRNEAEAAAFFDGVKQRGLARLEAEKQTHP